MRCLSLPARGSLRSLEHLVPGAAPVSSQCLQAPAGHHGPVLNQAVECGSSGQSAIISGCQLSVISGKAFPAKAAARPNPHSRPSAHRFPRVRSSEAFRRRPLYWVTRSRRAGIRNPSRKRSHDRTSGSGSFDPSRSESAHRKVRKAVARSFRGLLRSDTQAGPTRRCPPRGNGVSWMRVSQCSKRWQTWVGSTARLQR
jgi:hypothetical protein